MRGNAHSQHPDNGVFADNCVRPRNQQRQFLAFVQIFVCLSEVSHGRAQEQNVSQHVQVWLCFRRKELWDLVRLLQPPHHFRLDLRYHDLRLHHGCRQLLLGHPFAVRPARLLGGIDCFARDATNTHKRHNLGSVRNQPLSRLRVQALKVFQVPQLCQRAHKDETAKPWRPNHFLQQRLQHHFGVHRLRQRVLEYEP